jgi:hypothetical protein
MMAEDPADLAFAKVKDAPGKGEYLVANDLAEQALVKHPTHEGLRHRAVLALARTGAVEQALERYEALGLNAVRSVDAATLGGRLLKDLALATTGDERKALLNKSIAAYEHAFEINANDCYPAINIATLALLADRPDDSTRWAQTALDLTAGTDHGDYYALATKAEAHLLLRQEAEAAAALDASVESPSADYASRATTRKRLGMIVSALGLSADVLAVLVPRAVLHYCGHIIAPPGAARRFPADQESGVIAKAKAFFAANKVGRVVGSLASGADIIIA